ncbi:GntR family transcriptional regulator [Streptomyces lavendulae]|uniref:GntR family transcriptional regulator n=1 Tax=Streptomyces lavendulae TaxID=1914 RepID=UPI0033D9026A
MLFVVTVRQRIVSSNYEAGQALPTGLLGAEFRPSSAQVRRALRSLVWDGWVKRDEQGLDGPGYYVLRRSIPARPDPNLPAVPATPLSACLRRTTCPNPTPAPNASPSPLPSRCARWGNGTRSRRPDSPSPSPPRRRPRATDPGTGPGRLVVPAPLRLRHPPRRRPVMGIGLGLIVAVALLVVLGGCR